MSSTDIKAGLNLMTKATSQRSMDELLETYNNNFYYNVVYVIILTIINTVILFTVFLGGSISDVVQNWPKYRCNPLIMPFAGLYGYDASENFNFCMKTIFNNNAANVLGPVYTLMSGFTDIASQIANSANSFRYLIANLLNGMERLMSSYRDRFQFLLYSIRMSYMKMTSLMGRLHGTFYAIIFMGLSGLGAAKNLANNDLSTFLLEFCFDPNITIILSDGTSKKLTDLIIGDKLKAVDGVSPVVTSIFRFNGSKTPMVKIGSTLVSKEHFTFYNGDWIKAVHHPDAISADSIPELVCLNTDTHVLEINGITFADYDESSDENVIMTTQALSEMLLNSGNLDDMNDKTKDYLLGLEASMPIVLKDGSTKPIMDILIGDVLLGGGIVQGLIKERCFWLVKLPNGRLVSASQLIWDPNFNMWRRAAFVYPDACIKMADGSTMYQLSVTNNVIESIDVLFRDYREVNEPDMEAAYEQNFIKIDTLNNK
jgi:hypothetical protein